jgi:hypothetical protein
LPNLPLSYPFTALIFCTNKAETQTPLLSSGSGVFHGWNNMHGNLPKKQKADNNYFLGQVSI